MTQEQPSLTNTEEAAKIMAKLPDEERKVLEGERDRLMDVARHTAGVSVMIRNYSHGNGANVIPKNAEGKEFEAEKINAKTAHTMALNIVRSMNLPVYPTSKEALRNFPWNFETGVNVDQRQMSEYNLLLDGRSCLGRTAQAAALVELQFPKETVGCAEVLSDHLGGDMLTQVHDSLPYDEKLRDEWLKEVLLYEEPHAVVTVDGKQFDPLSTVFPVEIEHPKVQEHPLWEGIASAMMIAEAWLEDNPDKKLQILENAEKQCPGTTVVAENKASALILLGREDEAVILLKDVLVKRPCARTLFCLWLLTQDDEYKQRLDKEYTPYMIEILKKEGGL